MLAVQPQNSARQLWTLLMAIHALRDGCPGKRPLKPLPFGSLCLQIARYSEKSLTSHACKVIYDPESRIMICMSLSCTAFCQGLSYLGLLDEYLSRDRTSLEIERPLKLLHEKLTFKEGILSKSLLREIRCLNKWAPRPNISACSTGIS